MCGIAGVAGYGGGYGPAAAVEAMTTRLAHRGPDASSVWVDPQAGAGLGHTRLAIIDAEGGAQPMLSADGGAAIVLNGEIYNFRALRAELQALGRTFVTRSDTEVALQAFLQWGEASLGRLRGMFAFAVYDRTRRALFLARDRTGIKPLYYADTPRGFGFASELKALLAFEGVTRGADWTALADYFVLGYPLLPRTFFRDCRELEPGCWLRCEDERITGGRYWSWRRRETPMSWEEATAGTERALKESLVEHLESDVPVGAFLSGGIDSSLILSLLAEALPRPPAAFTASFGEKAYDESAAAAAVARRFGAEHHVIRMDANAWDVDRLGAVVDQFDQPFGDSSAIPTYFVCQEIRRHVKVVLSGDGGDEMFGGYPRFAYADLARSLGAVRAHALRPLARALRPVSADLGRIVERMLTASRPEDRLVALCGYRQPRELAGVVSDAGVRRLGGYRTALSGGADPGGGELIDATVAYALPGDYLRKVDVVSGAHGLEVRVPFLGTQVLDFAATVPHRMKCRLGTSKRLLRLLAARRLPPEIAAGPKRGFGLPFDSWLGDGRRRALAASLLGGGPIRDVVKAEYLESQVRAFLTGRVDAASQSRYHAYQQVYMLWSLDRWLRRWNPS